MHLPHLLGAGRRGSCWPLPSACALLLVLAHLVGCAGPEPAPLAGGQPAPAPTPTPTPTPARAEQRAREPEEPPAPGDAVGALLALFDAHDVVLLGESPHQGRRIHAFYEQLLSAPAFPRRVDAILVEFGSARHQAWMDRYLLELEDIPAERLAACWRDTTQLLVWDSPLYEDFFRRVRTLNEGLARGQRVRVLLGDPPIEWERVHAPADLERWYDREASLLAILEREVLSRNQKALVVIGATHLLERNPRAGFVASSSAEDWLGQLLQARHPGRACGVYPFLGPFHGAPPSAVLAQAASWSPPALVMLADGPLGEASFGLVAPALTVRRRVEGATVWAPLAPEDWPPMRVMVDALLYLGEREAHEEVPPSATTYRDPAYVVELQRRAALLDAYFGVESYVPSLAALMRE